MTSPDDPLDGIFSQIAAQDQVDDPVDDLFVGETTDDFGSDDPDTDPHPDDVPFWRPKAQVGTAKRAHHRGVGRAV